MHTRVIAVNATMPIQKKLFQKICELRSVRQAETRNIIDVAYSALGVFNEFKYSSLPRELVNMGH